MQLVEFFKEITTLREDDKRLYQKAVKIDDGKKVIINLLSQKTSNKKALKAFEDELSFIKVLSGDAAPKVLDLIKEDNNIALIFKDDHYQPLSTYLQENKLGLIDKIKICINLTNNLSAIHQQHILHRNFITDNCFININTLNTKIINFNCAEQLDSDQIYSSEKESANSDLSYISPELTGRTEKQIDYRADYYSLGIIFYEIFTDTLPFETSNASKLIHCHLAILPIPTQEINKELPSMISDMIMKLLAKNAGDRYQSITGILYDLTYCLQGMIERSQINPIVLGSHDKISQFIIPNILYGREKDLENINEVFEDVASRGQKKIILISGYSGVGKTSLVDASFSKRDDIIFSHGRFEKYKRNQSYLPLINAIEKILDKIIALPEDEFSRCRDIIVAEIGTASAIIAELIPSIEVIIGKQKEITTASIEETKGRISIALGRMITALTKLGKPLVIFIDDMQWANADTLQMIANIEKDVNIEKFLLIGAYRDNEVDEAHPLIFLMKNLQEQNADLLHQIYVDSINQDDTQHLMSDMLNKSGKKISQLAELVHKKTQGNPFYIKQFLIALHNNKLLYFRSQIESWQWNYDKIVKFQVTDNVLDFMTNTLKNLPEKTLVALEDAACIGRKFSSQEIAVLMKIDNDKVIALLKPACEREFIALVEDKDSTDGTNKHYRFIHDKVTEAAYALMPSEQKKKINYDYARYLQVISAGDTDQNIFSIVEHFERAGNLVKAPDEKKMLANYNLLAEKRAFSNAAFENALFYVKQARKYAKTLTTELSEDFTFSLNLEFSRCLFANKEFSLAENELDNIIENEKNDSYRITAYINKIEMLFNRSKLQRCLDSGFEALQLIGFNIKSPSMFNLIFELASVHMAIWRQSEANIIMRQKIQDQKSIYVVEILYSMLAPAFLLNIKLYAFLVLSLAKIILKKGSTQYDAYIFISIAVLEKMLGNNKKERFFYNLATQLVKTDIPPLTKALTLPLGGMMIHHDFESLETCDPIFKEAYNYAVESGSISMVCVSLHQQLAIMMFTGKNLSDTQTKTGEFLPIVRQMKDQDEIFCLESIAYLTQLLGSVDIKKSYYDQPDLLEKVSSIIYKDDNVRSRFIICMFKIQYYYLTQNYDAAYRQCDIVAKIQDFAPGMYYWYLFFLYGALTMIRLLPQVDKNRLCLRQIKKIIKKLKISIKLGNPNIENKLFIILAEFEVYKKNYDLAVTYFEKAIDLSRKNHFSHEEALANELMAQCYIAQNKETASRGYLLNSIELYQGWGCKFKVKLLGELYENISRLKVPQEVLLSSTDELNKNSKLDFSGAMDVETIFTATQTLAKEMNPEKLTNKIIMIMLANSGANRGALILESNETFFIEGYSSLVEESIPNILGQDIKSCQYFPAAIINYVAKTKKMLVMGSFADAKQKFNDSYFTHYSPESILCTPLIRSGKLQGIIYLENSLTRNTFTRDRIAMLEMLSVQAAISLEISRSYTAFERFVPKKFLDLLGKRRLVDIQLGDSMELTLTTLFCDLRNFTQISEQRASHETFTILNQFLSDVAPIIIKYEGFIDKYIGDAVLALFPTDKPDGAIKAAIEIQQAIQALNIRLKEQGLIEHALAAGIGINCGASVMGVLGSKERLDTTVISDAVNLASRVEALNKIYATDILVTNNVISRLVSPQSFELYQVDKVIVKGRTQAISIYEVINALPSEKKQVKQKFYNEFRQVISVYLEQDFDQAFILLNELKNKFPDEKIIDVFIEHSNLLSRSGVLENWKGAVELTSKY